MITGAVGCEGAWVVGAAGVALVVISLDLLQEKSRNDIDNIKMEDFIVK